MSDIVNKLRELNVSDENYVTLSYAEGAEVWHINDSHVEEAVNETGTVAMLAGLLASGVAVSDTYSDGDLLGEMRQRSDAFSSLTRVLSSAASMSRCRRQLAR